MRPHPRIRKTIKWGGAAATGLLCAVWFGSGWFAISYVGPNMDAYFGRGALFAALPEDVLPEDLRGFRSVVPKLEPGEPRWRWSSIWINHPGAMVVQVPLWWLLPLPALPALAAWWLDRRAHRNRWGKLCPNCGYDRAGLPPRSPCPECGFGQA